MLSVALLVDACCVGYFQPHPCSRTHCTRSDHALPPIGVPPAGGTLASPASATPCSATQATDILPHCHSSQPHHSCCSMASRRRSAFRARAAAFHSSHVISRVSHAAQ